MKTTPTIIKLIRQKPYLIIVSPYDQELVKDIKAINWKQREFNRQNNTWEILENDPDQSPDETNLEYIRRICRSAAERRAWEFNDYTAQSAKQIEQKIAQKTHELKEEHIKAICQVLPKLPRRALKLIRWNEDSLSLQLNYYLGENDEGQALWQELKEACTKLWKPSLIYPAFDKKLSFGFVFEVSSDIRVIKALMSCNQVENLKVHQCVSEITCEYSSLPSSPHQLLPLTLFDDSTAHLKDEKGNLWVAQDYHQVWMGQSNYDHSKWEVTQIGEAIYWVACADDLILKGWLKESNYTPAYFGGSFGVFMPRNTKLPQILLRFHLESWFKEWAIAALNSSELSAPYSNWQSLISANGYNHCADDLIGFFNKFMGTKEGEFILELLEISSLQLLEYKNKIQRLKEEKASEAYQEILRKAPDLASQKLNLKTKAELLKLAEKHQIPLKKSWTKTTIIASFVKNFSLCKELIGLR